MSSAPSMATFVEQLKRGSYGEAFPTGSSTGADLPPPPPTTTTTPTTSSSASSSAMQQYAEQQQQKQMFNVQDSAGGPICVAVPAAPVTVERPPPGEPMIAQLGNAGMPRAVIACDRFNPHGLPDADKTDRGTVLQKHVAFFDRSGSGVIYPWHTYCSMRSLGYGLVLSLLCTAAIHVTMSVPTWPDIFPRPLLPIYVERIHCAKHGSDTESFDTEGRFVPQKFEEIFSKYSRRAPERGLHWTEALHMVWAQRNAWDFVGTFMSVVWMLALYVMARDEYGFVGRNAWLRQYDGTLFRQTRDAKMRHERSGPGTSKGEQHAFGNVFGVGAGQHPAHRP